MSEYLVLLKLNPGKLIDTLGAIRNLPSTPVSGVDVCYSMNIFGAWDVGLWIKAEDSNQALEFVQKKAKDLVGVTEVYTIPTFPHRNRSKNLECQEIEEPKNPEVPLKGQMVETN